MRIHTNPMLAALCLTALLLFGLCSESAPLAQEIAEGAPTGANIVLIVTDDMRLDDLPYMPNVNQLFGVEGVTFDNYYDNVALCCPARASILRGQYAHNTTLYKNNTTEGGYQKFASANLEGGTVAKHMHDRGYETALIGKYLNTYPTTAPVPVGWDNWQAITGASGAEYYGYHMNENGTIVWHDEYAPDLLRDKALDFMANATKPFFLYFTPPAPHTPTIPADRHMQSCPGVTARRTPNFNEADVSDKPAYVKNLPLADPAPIDAAALVRCQSLQATDEAVAALVAAAPANTYFFFISDNGFMQGNHRIAANKDVPYQEAVHLPLLARGPDFVAGTHVQALAGNVDLYRTFTNLAGLGYPSFVDGRQLAFLARGEAVPSDWRKVYILQRRNASNAVNFDALVTASGWKYIEYLNGFKELYDLNADPYELQNRAGTQPVLETALHERLMLLKVCKGATCRTLEAEPLP